MSPTVSSLLTKSTPSSHQLNTPIFLKPTSVTTSTIPVLPNTVQNAARYPSIRATVSSELAECAVTDAAIAAVTARPTELPNCATTLNTPPARDCVSGGKASEMTRFETLNSTMDVRDLVRNGTQQHVCGRSREVDR